MSRKVCKMEYIFHTSSVDETEAVGRKIAEILDDANIHTGFLSLYGEMGVGKTAFVRGFAAAFGIGGVTSPTYTVVNEYRGKQNGVLLFHFDLYRICSEDDLFSIGFDDYASRAGFCLTEWSENVEYALPKNRIRLSIVRTARGEDERMLTLYVPDGFPCDFSAAIKRTDA